MMLVLPFLMRKNDSILADLSAHYHRHWQLYNGLIIAMEYGVTDRPFFGSDCPVRRPVVGYASFTHLPIGHHLDTVVIKSDFLRLADTGE
ncbi:MAG: hypothetical protein OXQ84_02860 [bacterium]|nr:hypothetical protein [bacterium]